MSTAHRERQVPQLGYGRPFFRPTAFIGGSSDVTEELRQIQRAISDIAAYRYPDLRPYHWSDERYIDLAIDWQDNIRRPADPNVELAVFAFRGRIGVTPPRMRELMATEVMAPLRRFIAKHDLPIALAEGDDGVPLTGTVFELLEVLRARDEGESRPQLLIYRFQPPLPANREEEAQQRWLEMLFEEVWPHRSHWPQPKFVQGPLLELVRDDASGLLFGQSLSNFDLAFPGLASFGAAGGPFFFGRAEEAADIRAKLVSARAPGRRSFMILHGPSGAGKSSLARAGVAGAWPQAFAGEQNAEPAIAEFVVPDDEGSLERQDLKSFVEAVALASGLSALAEASEAWPDNIAPSEAAQKTLNLLNKGPRQTCLLIVIDQGERLLAPAFAGDIQPKHEVTGRFIAIRSNWEPILSYLDALTREAVASAKPCVVLTIADDAAERPSEAKSFFARLVGSKFIQRLEAEGGELAKRHVNPLGAAQARSAARLGFAELGLPPLDEDVLSALERSFDAAARSALPLYAIVLRKLATEAAAKAASGGFRGRRLLGLGDVSLPTLETVIDEQGEQALAAFAHAGPATVEEWDEQAVPSTLAAVLRQLVRAGEGAGVNDDARGRGFYTISAPLQQGEETRLAACLVEARLLLRVGRERYRLAHAAVVEHWRRAAHWFDEEYELARIHGLLEQPRRAGGVIPQDLALRAMRALDAWREDPHAFEQADRELIDEALSQHIPRLGKGDRFDMLIGALRTRSEKSLRACLGPPQGVALRDWVHVDPKRGSDGAVVRTPSPLVLAASAQHDWAIGRLLEGGADPLERDRNNWGFPHELAAQRRVAVLKRLLDEATLPLRAKFVALRASEAKFTPLHAAVLRPCAGEEDDQLAAEIIAALLDAGANVRERTGFKRTAMHYAAINNYPRCTQLMAERDPKLLFAPNEDGQIPLHFAALMGHGAVLRAIRQSLPAQSAKSRIGTMLRHKDGSTDHPTGRTPLFTAVAHGRGETARMLLDWGAPAEDEDGSGRTLVVAAVRSGNQPLLQSILTRVKPKALRQPDRDGRTPLHHAVASADPEALAHLFARMEPSELDPLDRDGATPLVLALRRGVAVNPLWDRYRACARRLIARGADVNAPDGEGRTPMLWAAGSGALDIVNLIAQRNNAAVNQTSRVGRAPLHDAMEYGRPDIVRRLVRLGADVGLPGSHGNTPLHVAAYAGRVDTMTALLNASPRAEWAALLNLHNEFQETPLHSAVDGGRLACVDLLVGLGGDINARNARGRTPLSRAIAAGRDDLVRALLESDHAPAASHLAHVVSLGRADLAALLLRAGADANGAVGALGETPLMGAIRNDQSEIADLLVEAMSREGLCRVETRNQVTAMHMLSWKSLKLQRINRGVLAARIADRLLERRMGGESVDELINRRDGKGRTPLRNATRAHFDALASVLTARGARDTGAPVGERQKRSLTRLIVLLTSESLYVLAAALVLALWR